MESNFTTANPPDMGTTPSSISDILTSVIYTGIGLIGIAGNGLVIIIFRLLNSRRSRLNAFVLNQALADFITSLFLIAFGVSRLIRSNIPHERGFGEFLCRFWWSRFFLFSCFAVSTFNLTAMSVERFIAVVRPLKYKFLFTKRRTLLYIVLIWIIAPIMQWIFPIWLYQLDEETNSCIFQATWSFKVTGVISGVALFLWEYFFPVMFMLFAYISILKTLKQKAVRVHALAVQPEGRNGEQNSSNNPTRPGLRFNFNETVNNTNVSNTRVSPAQARRRNVTFTLFTMFIVYVICWTPNQLTFLQFNLGGRINFNGIWYHVTVFMAFLNACVNPFIYALKHEQFKRGVKDFLSCGGNTDENRSGQLISSVSGSGTTGLNLKHGTKFEHSVNCAHVP